ncbi:hypothetical protein RI129_009084 [Pyrocoelia pectoralis]|uniref:DUF243 domain-containing protein n=1 Tax=Pyrocoelia pectoralis TaxID=417401 RepID=A0AAN7ZGI4_9COLE
MKFLTVTLSLVVVANARPDVSHLPTGSYLPSGHAGESSGQFGSISNFGGGGGQTSFGSGQTSFGGGQTSFGSGQTGFGSGQTSFGSGQTGFGSGQTSFGSTQGSFEGHSGGIGIGGGFQDQKHVYFFAAPDEESSGRLRIQIVPNSQRNTKIIFVKAPSYGSVQPEVIAPPSISEDKTLVYVLVKRPEHGGVISIPAGAGVKAAKPEVYFIKYKTQQDAQQQIAGGLHGQQVGANIPDLGNEANFVRTLESGISGGSIGGTFSQGSGIGSIGSIGSGSQSSSIFSTGSSGSSQFGPAGASGPY